MLTFVFTIVCLALLLYGVEQIPIAQPFIGVIRFIFIVLLILALAQLVGVAPPLGLRLR
jgi:hypothetical protein